MKISMWKQYLFSVSFSLITVLQVPDVQGRKAKLVGPGWDEKYEWNTGGHLKLC